MNDYWNDPPEYHAVPDCCDQEMTVDDQGKCRCAVCGKTIEPEPDIEPPPTNEEPIDFGTPETEECPHGKSDSSGHNRADTTPKP